MAGRGPCFQPPPSPPPSPAPEASPHAQGRPPASRWEPSPPRCRTGVQPWRCLPTVDLSRRLDHLGIGAPAPSRSPPLRSPPSARSPTPLRRCLARSATRRWRPTCQRPTAPARDRRRTGLHCCRCRRHRCRSRPPCTLPPPERGRAALRAAYLGGPLFRTHRVAASRVAAFRACVRGTWVFRGAVVVYYRVCLDCGSCIKFVSVYLCLFSSPLPPYVTYS
jgi:hypothetical protein